MTLTIVSDIVTLVNKTSDQKTNVNSLLPQ